MARILVIDDELNVLKAVEEMLASHGHSVITAADGEEGYKKACSETLDLIITDLILPKMDGWRVCQKLKSDARYRHIPIIMSSAIVGDESPNSEIEIGDAYVPKPFKSSQLLAKVQELLSKPASEITIQSKQDSSDGTAPS
jgi:DNA-binding response OmpR family regulator